MFRSFARSLSGPFKDSFGIIAIAGLGSLFLALALFQVHVVVALGAVLVLGAALALLVWPDLATLIFLLVIYTNIAFVAGLSYGLNPAVAAVVWPLLLIPFGLHVVVRRQKVIIDYPFLFMLMFLLCLLLSFFVSRDKDAALKWILTYFIEGLATYFLLINVVRNYGMLKKAIGAVLVAGALLSTLTLYQDITGNYEQQFLGLSQRVLRFEEERTSRSLLDEDGRDREMIRRVHRADGPVGDPNYFAQLLIAFLAVALVRFYAGRTLGRKILSGLGLLLILSGVFLTYSRGAFVTLIVLIVIAVVMQLIRARHMIIAIGALLIVTLIVSPGYLKRIGTIGAVQSVFGGRENSSEDQVILSRATEMLAAMNVFLDHPILGVGPGQYTLYSVDYMSDLHITLKQHDTERAAHSLYFQLAAEMGVLGFVTFMAIAFLVQLRLYNEWRRWKGKRPEMANLAAAFFIGILGYFGTGVFLTFAFQRYYWIIMALAGATVRISRIEYARKQVSNSERRRDER